MIRRLLPSLLLALAFEGQAKSSPHPPRITPAFDTIQVARAILRIEIADSDSLRTRGLSYRKTLGWNDGMLFVFPDAARRAFWMIDCHFDLDIAYIAPDGRIRDIQTMRVEPGVLPQDLTRYPSATDDVMYALEVNRGWFASHGIRTGDRLPGIPRHRSNR